MIKLNLDPFNFPILSSINGNILEKTIKNQAIQANPNKKAITQQDEISAAQMLEMDLNMELNQSYKTQEKDLISHNKMMLERMEFEEINW